MGPVNVAMERRLIRWMAGLAGWEEGADGVFTSGGSIGNLTALLAARQASAEGNVWKNGVGSEPPLAVLVSAQCHYSVRRAAYGTDFFAGYITAMYDLARDFARLIKDAGDFETAVEPESNIVCFRHLKKGEADLDGLQRRIRRAMLEQGTFYIVQTELGGRHWLRCTLINPRTTIADLEALLAEIRTLV